MPLTITFDAVFTSLGGAHGLLSVYWDTNMIGLLDESNVRAGSSHYTLSFPSAAANSYHVLGFHLDPFTATQSTITLTNIAVECSGVSQPFSLSITTNAGDGTLVYQLKGQPANYHVQASTDMIEWTNIAILANTSGTVLFADQGATNFPLHQRLTQTRILFQGFFGETDQKKSRPPSWSRENGYLRSRFR